MVPAVVLEAGSRMGAVLLERDMLAVSWLLYSKRGIYIYMSISGGEIQKSPFPNSTTTTTQGHLPHLIYLPTCCSTPELFHPTLAYAARITKEKS